MGILSYPMLILFSLIPVCISLLALHGMLAGRKRSHGDHHSKAESQPRVLVMMPCKGEDIKFDETLQAVKNQDYPNYKMVAIVDSYTDAACEALARHGIETLISDEKLLTSTDCSGKNRALITALALNSKDFGAYVVIDSDTTVGKNWLKDLVTPLVLTESVGLSTTFPLFYPLDGFWSRVKTVWGLVGSSMQNSRRTIFPWGGSMAFKQKLLPAAIMELSRSTADDIALGKACKELGMEVISVPEARPIVYVKETFSTFSEWSVRQTALSILGNSSIFKYGMVYYSAFCINDLILLYLLYLHSTISALFALPILLNIIGFCLATGMYSPIYYIIVAFMPFVYAANLIAGRHIKHITWRGAGYKLH